MSRKLLLIILAGLLIFNLVGCSKNKIDKGEVVEGQIEQLDILDKNFEELLEAARGTTVTFYGWGGSQQTNSWIDGYLSENVKKDYDITVKRVGMNIDEILNSLLNEKQLNV